MGLDAGVTVQARDRLGPKLALGSIHLKWLRIVDIFTMNDMFVS